MPRALYNRKQRALISLNTNQRGMLYLIGPSQINLRLEKHSYKTKEYPISKLNSQYYLPRYYEVYYSKLQDSRDSDDEVDIYTRLSANIPRLFVHIQDYQNFDSYTKSIKIYTPFLSIITISFNMPLSGTSSISTGSARDALVGLKIVENLIILDIIRQLAILVGDLRSFNQIYSFINSKCGLGLQIDILRNPIDSTSYIATELVVILSSQVTTKLIKREDTPKGRVLLNLKRYDERLIYYILRKVTKFCPTQEYFENLQPLRKFLARLINNKKSAEAQKLRALLTIARGAFSPFTERRLFNTARIQNFSSNLASDLFRYTEEARVRKQAKEAETIRKEETTNTLKKQAELVELESS